LRSINDARKAKRSDGVTPPPRRHLDLANGHILESMDEARAAEQNADMFCDSARTPAKQENVAARSLRQWHFAQM
jgi:hypothetical protein